MGRSTSSKLAWSAAGFWFGVLLWGDDAASLPGRIERHTAQPWHLWVAWIIVGFMLLCAGQTTMSWWRVRKSQERLSGQ